ncbi:phosphoenolpyruvate--protein phosphotransferase [Actinopolymorpha singaporensis]|uniref:Phosphocarrier protein HPr n=1 Tax=Actinopolymorpha singaporensis TaxID=117157 RepID=A0A1H1PUF2_9ACTN|nr:phosphoenolpyruvate--protein phosphotransferase [Actinopolymorpha singaporensis]SDS14756.1 Phosphocarrier protein HPr /phosphoenolpyruvate--protein phosphotransferase /dihydroxyacetone kinase DhaM subunit [Actinopolymorpha singaporensis]
MPEGPVAQVGLVLIAHVAALAEGVRTLAAQMAPEVDIRAVGGTDDGGVGTSFDAMLAAVTSVLADVAPDEGAGEGARGGAGVAVLYDLGSAQLTAELVLETLDPGQSDRVLLVDAPLVEGAVAAATTAAGGAGLAEVAAAARAAYVPTPAAGEAETPETPEAAEAEKRVEAEVRARTTLRNPAGLHARPAAALAHLVREYDARVTVGRPGDPGVAAAGVLGVVAQGLRVGTEIEVAASGSDSRAAVDAVLALADAGFGELDEETPAVASPVPPEQPAAAEPAATPRPEPGTLRGVGASAGLVVAPVRHLRRTEPRLPSTGGPHDPAAERRRLVAAVDQVNAELGNRAAGGGSGADIAGAHQAMLADPALLAGAEARLDQVTPAEVAWWGSVLEARDLLAGGAALVAERAVDVEDLGRAVLGALGVDVRPSVRPEDVARAVVVAEEVFPSDVAALGEAGVAGLAVARGGRTSHAAILARGLELPMVVRLGPAVLDVPDGTPVVLDARTGQVRVDPPEAELTAARRAARDLATGRERARAAAAGPVVRPDGTPVTVSANVGGRAEARAALAAGADAVGLLRTELLYVDRPRLPGEDEQAAELGAVLAELGDRRAVVRTLDVGGDKLLPALDLDPWRHGPLGVRGVRYAFGHPDLLRTQLRAVLRAAYGRGEVWLMAPMVTVAAEARRFRLLVEEVAGELAAAGTAFARPAKVGVMVEVPAAALVADEICAEVDFVSVGSNDLTQYVMAADRTNDAVGDLYQPGHEAVWRLLATLVDAARSAGRHVAVCGELAGEPDAAVRLVRMGVDELSMAPSGIPDVKAALRSRLG